MMTEFNLMLISMFYLRYHHKTVNEFAFQQGHYLFKMSIIRHESDNKKCHEKLMQFECLIVHFRTSANENEKMIMILNFTSNVSFQLHNGVGRSFD